MKFLLLHLSDFHITGGSDVLSERVGNIVDSVRNLSTDLEGAVIAITGDIAYSGNEHEYFAASDLLDRLKNQLSETLVGSSNEPIPIHTVVVPGNHDSHLPREIVIRNTMMDRPVEELVDLLADDDTAEYLMQPQRNFFDFRNSAAGESPIAVSDRYSDQIAYQYNLSIEGTAVTILCCNTSILTRRNEVPGSLGFPVDSLDNFTSTSDLVIAMFHHPFNWLEPNIARAFREKIEATSDFILTGHEHSPTRAIKQTDSETANYYVEGGALQDSYDPDVSQFNAFVIDTQNQIHQFVRFEWREDHYARATGTIAGMTADPEGFWEAYPVTPTRQAQRFELAESLKRFLDDPGIQIEHPDRGRLSLEDVFVMPHLRESPLSWSKRSIDNRPIQGQQVFDLVDGNPRIVISGDDLSGKTSLAKTLFKHLWNSGKVPIYLDASEGIPTGERIFALLRHKFTQDYIGQSNTIYDTLDPDKRVIMIDDFHRITSSQRQRQALLIRLSHFARVIVFVDDVFLTFEDPASHDSTPVDAEYHTYNIAPFGHVARNMMIEKWLDLSDNIGRDLTLYSRRLANITNVLGSIFGRNYVPAYPVHILAIMQAVESTQAVDMNASTHGYFYELLINAVLSKGRTQPEFDITMNYLAELAWRIDRTKGNVLLLSDLKTHHDAFCDRYALNLPYGDTTRNLFNQNVLVVSGDEVSFRYPYLFFYFTARYVRDHISEPEVKSYIHVLAGSVHIERRANILLFVAHLTRDKIVVDELTQAAMRLYAEVKETNLGKDAEFLNTLGTSERDWTHEDGEASANRREAAANADQHANPEFDLMAMDDSQQDIDPTSVDAPTIFRFRASIRTLEILGQLLKNYPGTIERSGKNAIARQCYGLARRMIGVSHDLIRSERENLLGVLVEEIMAREEHISRREAYGYASAAVGELAQVIAFSMVKATANAVGAPRLGSTYDDMLSESPEPVVALIDLAIKLEHGEAFPVGRIRQLDGEMEGNRIAQNIIRQLAVLHFDMFEVAYPLKQEVCDVLDIQLERASVTDPRKRLLKSG